MKYWLAGYSNPACSRPWSSPVTTPPSSATCATRRWAPVSRFSGRLAVSVVMLSGLPRPARSGPRLDDDLAAHGVVRDPAVLVAGDEVLAQAVEVRAHARNLSGDQHDVDVDAGNEQAVDHVPARGDERHRGAHGHVDLVWREGPDL